MLDLAPVTAGSTPADALRNTRELAQLADRTGYTRYWLAEHHNMTGIASAATAVVIANVAGATELHEMATVDGEVVMRKAEGGIIVEAGKHQHLAPGGPHIMLMNLARELPAGSEELGCTLTFDDGQTIDILAPVKQFTEEQDTYHTHEGDGSGD